MHILSQEYRSIRRTNAGYNGCNYAADCSTPLGFEETLNKNFPTSTAADFAPLEAGLIDEDTCIEQELIGKNAHWRYLEYLFQALGVKPDLLMLGYPVTDELQHQFLALITSTDIDGDPVYPSP
jgi:hypothetical protein